VAVAVSVLLVLLGVGLMVAVVVGVAVTLAVVVGRAGAGKQPPTQLSVAFDTVFMQFAAAQMGVHSDTSWTLTQNPAPHAPPVHAQHVASARGRAARTANSTIAASSRTRPRAGGAMRRSGGGVRLSISPPRAVVTQLITRA